MLAVDGKAHCRRRHPISARKRRQNGLRGEQVDHREKRRKADDDSAQQDSPRSDAAFASARFRALGCCVIVTILHAAPSSLAGRPAETKYRMALGSMRDRYRRRPAANAPAKICRSARARLSPSDGYFACTLEVIEAMTLVAILN